jgi:hypothetical protein
MDTTITARNPRAEAQAWVGDGHRARVLEPSPPAVTEEPWFADDPAAAGGADGPAQDGSPLVVPTGLPGDLDWSTWLVDHPEHADAVAASWLGGPRRLPSLPDGLAATRTDLHRLAVHVIAPVRHRANGKFGLRWTRGGFGTPFFPGPEGQDRQIRVEGTTLVDQRGDVVRTAPIGSLAAAARFLETEIDTESAAEHDSPPVGDADAPLTVDEAASRFLGDWYGMAFAALETLRADPASLDPSRPQLWPGHFDPAIEVGDEDHRASYGASPGDGGIAEPYLYVSIWWPDRIGVDGDAPVWNAPSFTGAVLRLSGFAEFGGPSTDPVETAARFWREARDRLG